MLTVTLILIIAAFAFFAAAQRIHINNLNAEIDRERARHEVTNELLTEARNEAKVENDLRRQAERNLAEANDEVDTWRALAMHAENALSKYTRQRDPKTGRFVKPDWVSDESREAASKALEMDKGLAEFHNMMGNAIDQLNALTVRKLCDEVKENAGSGI